MKLTQIEKFTFKDSLKIIKTDRAVMLTALLSLVFLLSSIFLSQWIRKGVVLFFGFVFLFLFLKMVFHKRKYIITGKVKDKYIVQREEFIDDTNRILNDYFIVVNDEKVKVPKSIYKKSEKGHNAQISMTENKNFCFEYKIMKS